jgi:hypothetical protein
MPEADVTLQPNLENMDLARSHVMILTSPAPLSCFLLETGLGVRLILPSHRPDLGVASP